jgi:ribose/xylose/arabinose/galactoside ABC-type transport system permease subunit
VRGFAGARYLDVWFLAVSTVSMVILFWMIQPSWLNDRTLQSIVAQNAGLAVVAMAMTFAIISRHIDLSPGSMLALIGAVIGIVYRDSGSLSLALLAGLGAGLLSGVANGILVAGLGLNAIMVTLAAFIWARGLAVGLTHGNPIVVDGGLPRFMNETWAGFSVTAPIVLVVYLAGWFLLRRTKLGRYTYAMGGDPVGARRAGIDVRRYTTLVFVLMGLMTALASIIAIGQLASAQPYAGSGLELDAIIAVIIGGTRLAGGEGNVGRTALGVAFISILNSGLLNLGLTDAHYQLYKGGTLLAVLSVQILLRRLVAEQTRRRREHELLVDRGAVAA